jgi:predicted metal-binding protein
MALTDCILHPNKPNGMGYGTIWISGKNVLAHRVAWAKANGPIPKGMHICHKCDVRNCVNPEHLFLGTAKDNMRDKVSKKRDRNSSKTHCKHGHEFTEANTMRNGSGRKCRTCHYKNCQKSYFKRKVTV